MVFDVVRLHRTERAGTNVQRDGDALHALRLQCCEDLLREVKASGRRSDGPDLARVNRLIPFAVGDFLLSRTLALYVRRNGSVAELVQEIHEGTRADELDLPHADAGERLQEPHPQLAMRTEHGLLSLAALPSGPDDDVPAEIERLRRLSG